MEKLDFALHVLYKAADDYPCNCCDFWNCCSKVRTEGGEGECLIKEAFDVVHQEILRKEDKAQ